MLLYKADI